MRSVQSRPPSPGLRRYVRAFAQRTVTGVFAEQPMPAFLETVLHFDFADLPTVRSSHRGLEPARQHAVVGPHTFAGTSLRFSGYVDSFAVFLQPTALWTLFSVPVSAVMEAQYSANDVLGRSVLGLWQRLGETPNFAERCHIAEGFLFAQIAQERPSTMATKAASALDRSGGRETVGSLASHFTVSTRQLERVFASEVGISPKRYARVTRFQAALDAKVRSPNRSWLDISTSTGYYDQMHLVHDFRSFAGFSPAGTISRLGDSRPSGLVEPR